MHQIFANIIHSKSYFIFRTRQIIYWPTRAQVDATMPESFKKNHPNCRVIIDCFEVRTEKPRGILEQAMMYSQYKKGHTFKVLVGVAPNGAISFISRAYGGRSSDTRITTDCGILAKLESGDVVLADKGFPEIQVDGVITVIPPRATPGQKQFTAEQMEETRKIAADRIHVERVIQRIKVFKILQNRFRLTLLPVVDAIVQMCAVLANISAPIFAQKDDDDEDASVSSDTEEMEGDQGPYNLDNIIHLDPDSSDE